MLLLPGNRGDRKRQVTNSRIPRGASGWVRLGWSVFGVSRECVSANGAAITAACYRIFRLRRRRAASTPTSPEPSNASDAGSGTAPSYPIDCIIANSGEAVV